jgi:Zn-dependent protease with chaperone function
VPYTEVYRQAVANIEARFPREIQLQQAYYRESLYYTHQLLLSGRVLFNDAVSQYIAEVADQLLRNRPELRAELRFYAVRSPAVNAFASGNGIILVNVGLIAQLESEAQLAFILSHEIAHYVKQHSLGIFLQSRDDDSNLRDLEQGDRVEALLIRQNLYSREAEMEADSWGLRLYLSSGYDLNAVAGVFTILQEAWRPFGSTASTVPDLLPNGIHLRAEWMAPPPNQGAAWGETVTSGGTTHPDPMARRAAVVKVIEGIPTGGRRAFFKGEDRFHYIQDCCRYTSCQLYLARSQYEYALIGLRDLLTRYPQHPDLVRLVTYGWYALARQATAGRFFDVHQPYFSLSGGARHLTWFTEQLEPAELTVVALLAAWHLHGQHPAQGMALAMAQELGRDLLTYHLPRGQADQDSLLRQDPQGLWGLINMQPGLADWLQDLSLAAADTATESILMPADRRQMSAQQRQRLLKGMDLDLDQVVFVNPSYQQIDERLIDPVRYVASEKKRKGFAAKLTQYAHQLKLPHGVLDIETLQPDELLRFRDLALLHDWLDFFDQLAGVSLLSPFHEEVEALCARHGTPYFAWVGCYAFTRYRVGKPLVLAAGFFFPPLFPYSMYYVFTPRYDTVLYLQVYDLSQHSYRLIYPRVIRMRDRPDVVNGQLYDLLSQFD